MKLRRIEVPEVALPKVGPLPRIMILPRKELLPEQQLEGTELSPFDPRSLKLKFKVTPEKESTK